MKRHAGKSNPCQNPKRILVANWMTSAPTQRTLDGVLAFVRGRGLGWDVEALPKYQPDTIQFALDYADTVISAAVNPIPREFDPEVTKKIESSKKMLQEITGEEEKKPEEKKPANTGKAAEKKSVRK